MQVLDKVDLPKLRILADFLDTIPAEQFDLGHWEYKSLDYQSEIKIFGYTLRKECGYAACAMGWAAHVNLFEGFKFKGRVTKYPYYQGKSHFAAVAALFHFPYDANSDRRKQMADYLFDPQSYSALVWDITPQMVVSRIRKLIKKVEGRIARYKSREMVEAIKRAALERVQRLDVPSRTLLVIEGTRNAKPSL